MVDQRDTSAFACPVAAAAPDAHAVHPRDGSARAARAARSHRAQRDAQAIAAGSRPRPPEACTSASRARAVRLAARTHASGTLVMRIEDIDRPRVVAGTAEAIMADLRWLGLDWDEGPDRRRAHAPYRAIASAAQLYTAAIETAARSAACVSRARARAKTSRRRQRTARRSRCRCIPARVARRDAHRPRRRRCASSMQDAPGFRICCTAPTREHVVRRLRAAARRRCVRVSARGGGRRHRDADQRGGARRRLVVFDAAPARAVPRVGRRSTAVSSCTLLLRPTAQRLEQASPGAAGRQYRADGMSADN